MLCRAQLTSH